MNLNEIEVSSLRYILDLVFESSDEVGKVVENKYSNLIQNSKKRLGVLFSFNFSTKVANISGVDDIISFISSKEIIVELDSGSLEDLNLKVGKHTLSLKKKEKICKINFDIYSWEGDLFVEPKINLTPKDFIVILNNFFSSWEKKLIINQNNN